MEFMVVEGNTSVGSLGSSLVMVPYSRFKLILV
jgi:hypothetical protein